MRVVQATIKERTLADELVDLTLRGVLGDAIRKWV